MKTIEIKNQLQLIYFMTGGHLRLSRQDLKFLQNLSSLLHNKSQVTTNQVGLMERIVTKYDRQLNKHDLYATNLVKLPWDVTIVKSSYEYTNAFIKIENGQILLKCPYNKKFVTELRSKDGNDAFTWNKQDKRYEAPFSTFNLKICIEATFLHFQDASCCPITTSLIDSILPYESCKYWTPTLVELNHNNYIIAANNEVLDNVLLDTTLNDDCKTLVKLVSHGVDISDTIQNKSKFHKFCSTYDSEVEVNDVDFLVESLVKIGADKVYVSSGDANHNKSRNDLMANLKKHNVKVQSLNLFNSWSFTNPDYTPSEFPVYIRFRRNATIDVSPVSKIITMVNSNPINIK